MPRSRSNIVAVQYVTKGKWRRSVTKNKAIAIAKERFVRLSTFKGVSIESGYAMVFASGSVVLEAERRSHSRYLRLC